MKEDETRMKTVKEAGSSRSRSWKLKVLGAALGLSTLGCVGGLVQASAAQARELDRVMVRVGSQQEISDWGRGWSSAMQQCQAKHPQTRSVELIGGGERPGPNAEYYQLWACRDTP